MVFGYRNNGLEIEPRHRSIIAPSTSAFCFLGATTTRLATSHAAMQTGNERLEADTIVDKIRGGEISVVEAVAQALPEVFRTHVVAALDLKATLNLAQVSKWHNNAVWSVDGVQSMKAKLEMYGAELMNINHVVEHVEAMDLAASHGNIPAVRALLALGEDVNKPLHENGMTALHCCSFIDRPAKVKALIELGADINKQDTQGCTALSLASRCEQTLNIMELIKAGADVDLVDNNGNTPLMWAVTYVCQTSTHILLFNGAGADVHKANNQGVSPLDQANMMLAASAQEDPNSDVHHRYIAIVKMLKHASSISA